MKIIQKYFPVLIIVLASLGVQAQVSVRLATDKNKILIGEPIRLTVDAYMPLGSTVLWPQADTIAHFEIDQRSVVDTSQNIDGKKISQSFTITSFDSGRWQIPPFEVVVDGQPYYSDSVEISVAFISFDPKEDYRDIKDIIETEEGFSKYIPWIIALVSLIILIVLIFILRKKRKPVMESAPKEPAISAYDEAMKALENIKKSGTTQLGEKLFYTSINDVLRRYLSRRFKVSTFERTNEELIIELSKLNIPRDSYAKLSQSLRMADFVKFAKYRPSDDDNRHNLEIVRSSIEILDNTLSRAV